MLFTTVFLTTALLILQPLECSQTLHSGGVFKPQKSSMRRFTNKQSLQEATG